MSTYLRTVIALGLGSMGAALPILVFAYFYELGMGLYLEFAYGAQTAYEPQSSELTIAIMRAVASLPLQVVLFAVLLPLQDSILRGDRRSLGNSARHAIRRAPHLILSLVVQAVILIGPPLLLLGGVGLFVRSLPSLPGSPVEVVRAAGYIALIPCGIYAFVMALLFAFAQPALILDSRGPLASIRASLSLVASHFGAVFGRFLIYGIVLILAMVAASLPIWFLQIGASMGDFVHPAVKVAEVIWDAAISAASTPFDVAAVLILYRALRPAGAGAVPGGGPAASPAETPRRATSPYQFE